MEKDIQANNIHKKLKLLEPHPAVLADEIHIKRKISPEIKLETKQHTYKLALKYIQKCIWLEDP